MAAQSNRGLCAILRTANKPKMLEFRRWRVDNYKEHKKFLSMDYQVLKHFEPYLTEDDIFNVEIYGCWLNALERGVIEPFTEEQEKFIRMTKGEIQPENNLTISWIKYKKLLTQGVICNICAGKGHYSTPECGGRTTCKSCHGAGKIGLTKKQISVDGTYY